MGDDMILIDILPSSFGIRLRIALALKGVEYEYKEENLPQENSTLLLQMNPVHKIVPVLIHNGRPICESLVILQYIDKVWNHKPELLPEDPHRQSHALFWADFIDKKALMYRFGYTDEQVYECVKKIVMNKGEVKEKAKKEMIECVKLLERELGEKLYFGGETLGFTDIALMSYYTWFYSYETCGDFSIEAECPKLMAWVQRCMEMECVSKSLYDNYKVYEYVLQLREKYRVH